MQWHMLHMPKSGPEFDEVLTVTILHSFLDTVLQHFTGSRVLKYLSAVTGHCATGCSFD